MTSAKDQRLYLVHVLECISRVRRYTEDYLRIDLEEVWAIIQRDLAPLSRVVGEELAQLDATRQRLEGEGST